MDAHRDRRGSRCRTSRATATARRRRRPARHLPRASASRTSSPSPAIPRADGQPEASDYRYAIELLEDVVAAGCFASAVAAHPAGPPAFARPRLRPPPPRRQAARRRLRDDPVLLRGRGVHPAASTSCRRSASTSRCCPAIMPITNVSQVKRMADMSGAAAAGLARRPARRHRRSGRGPQDRRRRGDDAVRRPPRRGRSRPPPLRAQPPGRGARNLWQPRTWHPAERYWTLMSASIESPGASTRDG